MKERDFTVTFLILFYLWCLLFFLKVEGIHQGIVGNNLQLSKFLRYHFRGFPSKVLVYSWWAFVFLLLETYAANLSAVYTTNVIESNINSARDLLQMPNMKFGSDAGFAYAFLKV